MNCPYQHNKLPLSLARLNFKPNLEAACGSVIGATELKEQQSYSFAINCECLAVTFSEY
jgi:hypothetical protein